MVSVEILEGAVVALKLDAGLRVRRLVAVAGDELDTVVADELPWCAVFGDGGFHGTPGDEGGESAGGGRADGEAGVVVKDVDYPGLGGTRR